MARPNALAAPDVAEVFRQLDELRAMVRALQQAGRAPRDAADRDALALVIDLLRQVEDPDVTVAALARHARENPALAEALLAADVPLDESLIELGAWLRRVAGIPMDGYVLTRTDRRSRDGRIYRLAVTV